MSGQDKVGKLPSLGDILQAEHEARVSQSIAALNPSRVVMPDETPKIDVGDPSSGPLSSPG